MVLRLTVYQRSNRLYDSTSESGKGTNQYNINRHGRLYLSPTLDVKDKVL